MLRAVIDTNVWVSATLNRAGAPVQVIAAFRQGRFTLVTSTPLLHEIAEVLTRPRFARKYGVTGADVTEPLAVQRHFAEFVPVVGDLRLCRNPDDDIVIETAIRGRADRLVTRDNDLKAAPEIAEALAAVGIGVSTVRQFLSALAEEAKN